MSIVRKLRDALRGREKTPDDLKATVEAERLRDELETIRLSQRSGSAGENYQSGRGSTRQ